MSWCSGRQWTNGCKGGRWAWKWACVGGHPPVPPAAAANQAAAGCDARPLLGAAALVPALFGAPLPALLAIVRHGRYLWAAEAVLRVGRQRGGGGACAPRRWRHQRTVHRRVVCMLLGIVLLQVRLAIVRSGSAGRGPRVEGEPAQVAVRAGGSSA